MVGRPYLCCLQLLAALTPMGAARAWAPPAAQAARRKMVRRRAERAERAEPETPAFPAVRRTVTPARFAVTGAAACAPCRLRSVAPAEVDPITLTPNPDNRRK